MRGGLAQWLAPPQKVNKKLVAFQNVGGQETVSKYICHLGNIIAYFGMKNHEILSFQPCLQKLVCYKTEEKCHYLGPERFI